MRISVRVSGTPETEYLALLTNGTDYMRRVVIALFLLAAISYQSAKSQTFELDPPDVVLSNIPFRIGVQVKGDSLGIGAFQVRIGDGLYLLEQEDDGKWISEAVKVAHSGNVDVQLVRSGVEVAQTRTRSIPGWLSIVPPLIAILIALLFKRVVPALFLGIWVGATIAVGLSISGAWSGLLDTYEVYVLRSLADPEKAAIILFSFMIGGMVGIISKNGGMQGVVNRIVKWANSPRHGQIAAGTLGVAIFFDDYANSLVVGNTMRPVTDRLRISREKLAYIVDSTAAPVSCIAFVTTWIGYEVGLIGTALEAMPSIDESAYGLFLASIPYSFYPLLAVFFVFAVAQSRRDFGPMYRAELRARQTGQVLAPDANVDSAVASGEEMAPKEGKPQRMINAIVPVLVLIGGVLAGLYATGSGDTLRDIIGSADSYKALMWASLLSVLAAATLTMVQRILTVGEIVEAWYGGLKGMMFAMIILVLAWSLSHVTDVLHTADYLVSILGDKLNPGLVPAIVFVLAAATAFATGSSWGTMGILLPLVLPLAWAVMTTNGMTNPSDYYILYSTVACILAGSVWGDHCSPISDTTILSSMASGCDHMDHVRTQLPYALFVGAVAVLIGTVPTGFGFPWWLSLLLGAGILVAGLMYFGRSADEDAVLDS
jgi:Na+/H+ antiporter NhaC